MSKTITLELEASSVQKAIQELEQYKRWLETKAQMLRQKIGDTIAESARQGFSSAIVDDILNGNARNASVDVTVEDNGSMTIVLANGTDAVFVEFGAGVYHNGAVGTSPHPNGAGLGFTIGTYGKGRGARNTWGFFDGDEVVLTHGTPAAMPMYRGLTDACKEIANIARGVFSS